MRQRDHPRVGGEKWFIALLFEPCEGSPPRGRGKDGQSVDEYVAQRITPAWAGKSVYVTAKGQQR